MLASSSSCEFGFRTEFSAAAKLVDKDTTEYRTAQVPDTQANVDRKLCLDARDAGSCEDCSKIVGDRVITR